MRRPPLLLVLTAAVLLTACETKTHKLKDMYRVHDTGTFYVLGTVKTVGEGVTDLKVGEETATNLLLVDEDSSYTFPFLASKQTRQPVAGDHVKLEARMVH